MIIPQWLIVWTILYLLHSNRRDLPNSAYRRRIIGRNDRCVLWTLRASHTPTEDMN